MALVIPCPHCGRRPHTEFLFGGEVRALDATDVEEDFVRVYLPENFAGPQRERWFHALGCKTWFSIRRDTTTNEIA
jgi:heterotetrameric sarcosine oxidase delta subunit